MAKVAKFDIVDLPKLYLIGKEARYSSEAYVKGDNRIPAFWDACLADGTFLELEKQSDHLYEPAYVGLSTDWDLGYGTFSYICGMLFKEGATVPEGFVVREIGGEKAGVSWIKGRDTGDVCPDAHRLTEQAIRDAGFCTSRLKWSMESFNNPRFTIPDENGEIILDYYIPIGPSFESLGKRIIYAYMATYPPFKPVADCSVSVDSQRQMYDFLYESIKTINDNPAVIDIPDEPDDCYDFWQMNNSKPGLMPKMQNILGKFLAFYELLAKMGSAGEIVQGGLLIRKKDLRITPKTRDRLSLFGFACDESKDGYLLSHRKYKELFPAWKLHCSAPKDGKINLGSITAFLHGRFGGKQYTPVEIFGRLGDPVPVSRLEQYFLDRGYTCKSYELAVSYEKEYPNKQKAHMKIFFDWRKANPLVFEFKAPHFSNALKFYDRMDDELKDLVFNRTKTCDGCGYCIQTDKTGRRKRLGLPLRLKGEAGVKCPLFPSFTWGNADESMIGLVKKLFEFSEEPINSGPYGTKRTGPGT